MAVHPTHLRCTLCYKLTEVKETPKRVYGKPFACSDECAKLMEPLARVVNAILNERDQKVKPQTK